MDPNSIICSFTSQSCPPVISRNELASPTVCPETGYTLWHTPKFPAMKSFMVPWNSVGSLCSSGQTGEVQFPAVTCQASELTPMAAM